MIDHYDSIALLKSAHHTSGNETFLKVIERMEMTEGLCKLASAVERGIPTENGYSERMEKLVKEHFETTKQLVKTIRKWRGTP